MTAWLYALFGSASLAGLIAGAWAIVARLRREGAARQEIRQRLEAARRREELRRLTDSEAATVSATLATIAEAVERRRAEGATAEQLEALHRRTEEPWPPRS